MAEEEAEVVAPEEAAAVEAPDAAAATEPDEAAPAQPDEAAPAAEPEPVLAPKDRKRATKAAKSAKTPVAKTLTPEERNEQRVATRVKKAAERRHEREHARAKYKASEHERSPTPPREHVPGRQKTRQGIVVSDKADKTITVRIDVARRHRRYEKIVRTSSTVHAHDERNDAHIGDTVVVREARPLSRTKRWRLVEVIERAK
jgi:small subunit ribosomal protein S17